ncbi:Coiled-coil domain-containing protein 12 [Linum grandiflorum]
MTSEESSAEQAAAERRERLKALKAAQELSSTPDEGTERAEDKTDQEDGPGDGNYPGLKFRNYVPQAKELQEGRLAPPVLPKFEDPIAAAPPPTEKKEDPFLNIAPKKPNWDLRRDVQKKLDKLERRTQKALYKLTQEQENEKQAAETTEED